MIASYHFMFSPGSHQVKIGRHWIANNAESGIKHKNQSINLVVSIQLIYKLFTLGMFQSLTPEYITCEDCILRPICLLYFLSFCRCLRYAYIESFFLQMNKKKHKKNKHIIIMKRTSLIFSFPFSFHFLKNKFDKMIS